MAGGRGERVIGSFLLMILVVFWDFKEVVYNVTMKLQGKYECVFKSNDDRS